jgi:hypothetical protein
MPDWNLIGTFIGGAVVAGTGAWGIILKAKRDTANTKAAVAEDSRDKQVADAQSIVYKLMADRLAVVEKELSEQRTELSREREHSRMLERKFYDLDRWIRAQGLTPPSFDQPVVVISGGA